MGLEIKIPKFKFPKFKFKEIDNVEDINLENEKPASMGIRKLRILQLSKEAIIKWKKIHINNIRIK